MKKLFIVLNVFCLILSFFTNVSASNLLWGVTGVNWQYSQVFQVNTTSGTVTIINNNSGQYVYSSIAQTPSTNLYTVGLDTKNWDNFDDFFRLDPLTGSIIGHWANVFGKPINGLTYESNISLLGIEGGSVSNPRLVRINLDAAGNYSSHAYIGSGITSNPADGSIVHDPATGKWYGTFWTNHGSDLYEINTTTGVGTLVSNTGISSWGGTVSGMAFSGGILYGSSWADEKLYTINVSGGHTAIWNLDPSLSGPIYGLDVVIPEPGTFILLGLGMIGLAGLSRKKLFKK